MTHKEFINKFANLIIPYYEKEKVIPSLIIAQAILESGWGLSELSKKANNYFGLNNYHDDVTKNYSVYIMKAPQEYDGKVIYNEEEFCLFKSIEECVACMFAWYNRKKYASLHNVTDYKKACEIVKACGYATDSNYTTKLIKIIEQNKLYEYDNKVLNNSSTFYYVQAGAFEKIENAKRRKELLLKNGFSVIVKQTEKYYKIQCGAFIKLDNAENLKRQLIKKLGVDVIISTDSNGKEVLL